jgi:hypothetical protein
VVLHLLTVLVCFSFWMCSEDFTVSIWLSVTSFVASASKYIFFCVWIEHFIFRPLFNVTSSVDSASK